MKHIKKSAVALLLLIAMFTVMFVPDSVIKSDAADTKTQSLQDQIDELNRQIDEYKSQLADLSNQKDAAMDVKSKIDVLLATTQKKIETAEQLSEKLEGQIADTAARIAQKEEDIKTTFNKFLERLVVSYEEGDASYLSIIANSSDMGDFLSRMDMVSSMLEYDRNLKIQYQNEKAALEAEKISLEKDKEYQANLIEQLKKDKEENEALSAQQQTYLISIQGDLDAAKSQLAQAQALDEQLNNELQAWLAELAAQQRQQGQDAAGFIPSSGFAWPLPGYSYISSGFGWRTLWGMQDFHRGIDIPAQGGTPIHASKSGKVITATLHGSYGNYVVLDNGINENGVGESTLYAHMSAIGCSVGQFVNQGDVIGYVGTTGNSTGNHLHFEVRMNGEIQNPLNYVSP